MLKLSRFNPMNQTKTCLKQRPRGNFAAFGQAKMFKQVKNLKKEFETQHVYKKENHRFGKINDNRHRSLILGVGKNASGPLGQTKQQIVKSKSIKYAVSDLIREIDAGIIVEDAKFRNSNSFGFSAGVHKFHSTDLIVLL